MISPVQILYVIKYSIYSKILYIIYDDVTVKKFLIKYLFFCIGFPSSTGDDGLTTTHIYLSDGCHVDTKCLMYSPPIHPIHCNNSSRSSIGRGRTIYKHTYYLYYIYYGISLCINVHYRFSFPRPFFCLLSSPFLYLFYFISYVPICIFVSSP